MTPQSPIRDLAARVAKSLPRPGLVAVALIGATTWIIGLVIAPIIAPVPPSGLADAVDHDHALDPLTTVLTLTVPDGMQEVRPKSVVRRVSVKKGDTLMRVLTRARITRTDAHAAITALGRVFNPRSLMPGQEISLTFQPLTTESKGPQSFRGLEIKPDAVRTVAVQRSWDNQFESWESKVKLVHGHARAEGTIDANLYVDAAAAGVPVPVIGEMIRAFSFDVDFQRDVHPGDGFALLYGRMLTPTGKVVRPGEIVYAALTLKGKTYALYRHRLANGTVDYFNAKGEAVRKALMRTPVDGARLSSRFGRRRHPILGYNKMHRGVDFAAPRGTPVMAAGNGVIAQAGPNGAYGRYIRIRHNATWSTAYAHLRRFAKGVRRGKRVRQGQVIGYVGSTGRSTGPHLHFEIMRNNRSINPLSLRLPTGKTLKGKALAKFRTAKAEIDAAFAGLAAEPSPVAAPSQMAHDPADRPVQAPERGTGGP
jgi:murein DD-endopeptidase MepM/ murein hydrolase activator NlpD